MEGPSNFLLTSFHSPLFFFCGLPYLFTLSSSLYALLLGLAWRWADDPAHYSLFFVFFAEHAEVRGESQ
ncbi:hypothetical protein K457DRAFT_134004 [Linnemannia elongata AG-77]|uniref:Uncharacterized protein n=1 Tax=Linnemannia elongata AG-77 TaxID=1314771 RepID=A0A197KB69_9FUNG|nr:hypothetical protein K457DRAFT_134004 [Linnemannia elongata AG-77]